MDCQHDLIILDGFSDDKSFKITLCKKCIKVIKVNMQGEKPKEVYIDKNGLRIVRQNVLNRAMDKAIAEYGKGNNSISLDTVKLDAEVLEKWIYRE